MLSTGQRATVVTVQPVGATMLKSAGALAFDKMHQQDVSKHVLPFVFERFLADGCVLPRTQQGMPTWRCSGQTGCTYATCMKPISKATSGLALIAGLLEALGRSFWIRLPTSNSSLTWFILRPRPRPCILGFRQLGHGNCNCLLALGIQNGPVLGSEVTLRSRHKTPREARQATIPFLRCFAVPVQSALFASCS